MTQRDKIAGYDKLAAERDKYAMACYDMANHKFGLAVTRKIKDFDSSVTSDNGRYTIAMSFRAMPLFLVKYMAPGQMDQIQVVTDNEIQDVCMQTVESQIKWALKYAYTEVQDAR